MCDVDLQLERAAGEAAAEMGGRGAENKLLHRLRLAVKLHGLKLERPFRFESDALLPLVHELEGTHEHQEYCLDCEDEASDFMRSVV